MKMEDELEKQGQVKKGLFVFPNGDKYDGEYWVTKDRTVERHGTGTFSATDGLCYQGCWVRDKMHGRGKLAHPSGAVYEGEFVENKYHGWGRYSFPDGSYYEGRFADNKMEGNSHFTDAYGQVWKGSFHGKAAPALKFKLDM